MDAVTLKERAFRISDATNLLADELAQAGFPEPSFEHGLPAPLWSDAPESTAAHTKQKLLQMVDELRALLTEPTLQLTPELRTPTLSVHSIVRLGIAENFPPEGTTVQDLASKLQLREDLVRRLLTHSATHHIYSESSPGYFVHTAASRVLAKNDGMRQWVLIGCEELLPSTLKMAPALAEYADSEEPEHCGWSMQNATDLPVFRALADMPDRANVFARAMKWHSMLPGFSSRYLVGAFPWENGRELTIVDIGGGLGHVSSALVEHNPDVKCIVQDARDVVLQGQETLSAELKSRITFQTHDFFMEQPVKGADVYLLRLILHNWSDKYATMIIRSLVPALKPGAKVIVNDRVIPAMNQAHYLTEREARNSDYDMYMLALQNGKERTLEDWSALFKAADPRFEVTSVRQPPRSILAVVEVTWNV